MKYDLYPEPLLKETLRFMADLNGSEWIKGNGSGEVDMRQRAKSLQKQLYQAVNANY